MQINTKMNRSRISTPVLRLSSVLTSLDNSLIQKIMQCQHWWHLN